MLTLKQTIDRIKEINQNGDYEVWFEGMGNKDFKLIIEEKKICIMP